MSFLTQAYYDPSKYSIKCGKDVYIIRFQGIEEEIFLKFDPKTNIIFVNLINIVSFEINPSTHIIRPMCSDYGTFESNYFKSAKYPYQIVVYDNKTIVKFKYNIEPEKFKICIETDGIFDTDDEVEPILLDLKISDDPI